MKKTNLGCRFPVNLSLSLLLFAGIANGQANQIATLPDAPEIEHSGTGVSSSFESATGSEATVQQTEADPSKSQQANDKLRAEAAAAGQGQQTKRILFIFPNFRAVSADAHLPPQTVKDKFTTATHDSFDYSSIVIPAAVAGYNQARKNTPEFHQGAAGYGRYFWHSFVDQTSENYFVEFIVPTITREDTRYYTLGHGGFLKRAGYSLSRAVITRNDEGQDTFNISEVVGAGAAAGISNLYYPRAQRSFSNTAGQWGQNIGIDAATFLAHEFWPDINHALFHGKD